MNNIIVAIVSVFMFLLVSGCERKLEPSNFRWSVIKSPNTGRCYELATRALDWQSGVAMMAEIPCEGR